MEQGRGAGRQEGRKEREGRGEGMRAKERETEREVRVLEASGLRNRERMRPQRCVLALFER